MNMKEIVVFFSVEIVFHLMCIKHKLRCQIFIRPIHAVCEHRPCQKVFHSIFPFLFFTPRSPTLPFQTIPCMSLQRFGILFPAV